MFYLLLAVGCSLAIGMIFKHAGRQGLDRMTLLTVNYAVAAALALLLIVLGTKQTAGGLAFDAGLMGLGVGTGVLFIAGFFLLSLATDRAGMSVAAGVMRVSVVVPFMASWVIWGEVPTPMQGMGLLCAGAAFFMIAAKGKGAARAASGATGQEAGNRTRRAAGERPLGEPAEATRNAPVTAVAAAAPAVAEDRSASAEEGNALRTFGLLVLLFITGGMVDTCMKVFDEAFADESSRALFSLMLFGVACLVGLGLLLRRRAGRPATRTLAWGALLGVVNYGSVEFILRAIRALRGPFVFPANNISIVMGAALLGLWFWEEELSALNRAGLGVAALALFLLRP